MPTLELPGADIYYEIAGDGEPLILVPGFASGAWSWSWQIEKLSRLFRVVTFDPRGVSRSTLNGDAGVSIDSMAGDVTGLLDELSIRSAHVLGISFGGFVAQEFALRFPDRVDRLILASTSFGGANHVAPSSEVMAAFSATDGLNSAARIRTYLTLSFSPGYVQADPGTVERFCELREANPVPRDVYMQQLQAAMAFDSEDRLANITRPTLIVTGDDDAVVPAQNSRNLASTIPHARLEVITGSGHMAFVERADEFNRIVREFLLDQTG